MTSFVNISVMAEIVVLREADTMDLLLLHTPRDLTPKQLAFVIQ